ncbi:hypothetical protein FGO68_gene1434 [Halteria grandinella]|uniref:Uncharacterized protein n=1 Tax=Halteria grandinella TaxID=5974 RepID=A0A8J8T8B9_HALGN|nr:hypothetical protein FGO68_gene1434 [Halteria grandinella]
MLAKHTSLSTFLSRPTMRLLSTHTPNPQPLAQQPQSNHSNAQPTDKQPLQWLSDLLFSHANPTTGDLFTFNYSSHTRLVQYAHIKRHGPSKKLSIEDRIDMPSFNLQTGDEGLRDVRDELGGTLDFGKYINANQRDGKELEWHTPRESIPGVQIYEGEVLRGTSNLHGQGVVIHDKSMFEGWFRDGRPHGHLRLIRGNQVEEGDFSEGVLTGFGIKTVIDKHKKQGFDYRYLGQFSNHLKHGFGLEMLSNGQWYLGYTQNDKFHGPGLLRKSDGSYFEATFMNNNTKPGTVGRRFNPIGSKQFGGWVKAPLVDFKPHGKGLMRAKSPQTGKFELFKVDMDMGRYLEEPQLIGEDPEQGIMHIPSKEALVALRSRQQQMNKYSQESKE